MQQPAQVMAYQPQPGVQVVQTGVAPSQHKPDPAIFPRTTSGQNLFGFSMVTLMLAVIILIFDAASIGLAKTIEESKVLASSDQVKAWAKDWKTSRGSEIDSYSFSSFSTYSRTFNVSFIGSGIWGGIFSIISASFGIAAGRSHKNKCLIITHMVLSIFTAVLSICMIIAPTAAIVAIDRCSAESRLYYAFVCDDDRWQTVRALQVVVLVGGLGIGISSIITSAFTCQSGCTCSALVLNRNYAPQRYVVVQQHTQQAPPTSNITINSTTTTGATAGYPHHMPATAIGGAQPPPPAAVHNSPYNPNYMPHGQPGYPYSASPAPYGGQATAGPHMAAAPAPHMSEKPPAYEVV